MMFGGRRCLKTARGIAARLAVSGLTMMAVRPPHEILLSEDHRACLGYTVAGRSAVALGPPAGPLESAMSLARDFEERLRTRGLRPVFCGVPKDFAEAVGGIGYRAVPVGDEAVVDPATVSLKGKRWREARAALNRGRRFGLRFRWVSFEQRSSGFIESVMACSDRWLSQKRMPELAFALGDLRSVQDPVVRIGVAEAPNGDVVGLVAWVPVPGKRGWMLELLRATRGCMAGLSDFLVTSSLLSFRDMRVPYASLSGTPFAVEPRTDGRVAALRLLFKPGRRLYDYEGLRHFKKKFNPVWQPLFLAHKTDGSAMEALLSAALACIPSTPGVSRRAFLARLTWSALKANLARA